MPTDKRARQRAARQAKLAAAAKAKQRRRLLRNSIAAVIVAAVVVGSAYLIESGGSSKPPASTASTSSTSTTPTTVPGETPADVTAQAAANRLAVAAGCPADPESAINNQTYAAAPAMTIDTSKTYTANVTTTLGNFVITLDPKTAPQTVNNFVFLAQKKFFNCSAFYRVIPGFVNQVGDRDPGNAANSSPGYTIADEFPPAAKDSSQQYALGAVVMAEGSAAHSGNSQFFFVAGAQGEALPNTYALFGQVTSGLSVIQAINNEGSASGIPPLVTQRILTVTITES